MPSVLITGLNGFVAVHTAFRFLENGWSVRGTVRSASKAEGVKNLPALSPYAKEGKVEIVVLEDLVDGDFTEALQGVDAIAHCASPWHFKGETWASYRDPAVKGTTNILEQAKKVDTVKAVSVVSSFAAIGDFSKPAHEQDGKVYTEDDWLPWVAEDMEKLKAEEGAAVQWYCASKKYAELAAQEVHKNGAKYSLSTLNPPVILGPAINYAPGVTPKELEDGDVSTSDTFKSVASGKDGKVAPTPFPLYAEVRNVADAIYHSVTQQKSGRFPLFNSIFDYQGLADSAREFFPDLDKAGQIPVGNPEDRPSKKGTFKLDGSKAERELGLKYIPYEQTVKDIVEQFVALGVVKA